MAKFLICASILLSVLPDTSGHSKQFQLLRNVLSSSMAELREEQKTLREDILTEVNSRVVPHIRQALRHDIQSQIRRELQTTQGRPSELARVDLRGVKEQLQRELQSSLKEDLILAVRQQVQNDIRSQVQRELQSNRGVSAGSARVDLRGVREQLQRDVRDRFEGPLKESLKKDLMTSLRGEVKKDIQSQVRKQIQGGHKRNSGRDLTKEIKGQVHREIKKRIDGHLKKNLKEHLLQELTIEVQKSVRDQIKREMQSTQRRPARIDQRTLSDQIQRELTEKFDEQLVSSLKEELMQGMKEEVQNEVNSGLSNYLRASLKDELSQEMQQQIKKETQSRMVGDLKDSIKDDVIKQIEKDGPLKVQTKLTPYQRRLLKQSIVKEVKVEVDKTKIMKEVRNEINRVRQSAPQAFRKDDIMEDIRKEIAKSHQRKDVQRMLKDGILKDVRKEIHEMQRGMDGSIGDEANDQRVKEYVDRFTGDLVVNSEKMEKELEAQEETIKTLKRRIHHLEKQLKSQSTTSAHDKKDKKKASPDPVPTTKTSNETPSRRHKNKPKTDPPKKTDLENSRVFPPLPGEKEIPPLPRRPLPEPERPSQALRPSQPVGRRQPPRSSNQNPDPRQPPRTSNIGRRQPPRPSNQNTGRRQPPRSSNPNPFTPPQTPRPQTPSQTRKPRPKNETPSRQRTPKHRVVTPLPPRTVRPRVEVTPAPTTPRPQIQAPVTPRPRHRAPPVITPAPVPEIDHSDEDIYISSNARSRKKLPMNDSLLIAKQNHSEAYFVELLSGTISILSASFGKYVGDLSYDRIGQTLYWSDWRVDAIFSYSVIKADQTLIKPSILSYGVEVDTKGRVIVCSDYWSRRIFTMDIDTPDESSRSMNPLTQIKEGNPMRIALDTSAKKVYVSVSYTKIVQINYDSGKTRTIVEIQRGFINGLGMNPKTKTLYFNNFTSLMAKDVTKRRREPKRVSHRPGKEPADILVHEGDVYIAYYNSEDVDVLRHGETSPARFAQLPFGEGHLRTSLCFIPSY